MGRRWLIKALSYDPSISLPEPAFDQQSGNATALAQEGVLEVYMTGGKGGPTYFFGLKIYKLGIFLGQVICHVFF